MRKTQIQLSDHFTYQKLLRFVLPSIVMMLFTSIYGVVDGLFVSDFAGKTPFAVARHPRYRAGYDFLLLRSQVGEVSEDLPAWWDAFVAADDDERVDMVREQQALSRRTGDDARRGRAAVRPQGEAVAPADAGEDGERKRRRRRRRKPKAGGDVGAAGSDGE